MKIIILGAGKVGTSLVEILHNPNNNITIIDVCKQKLNDLEEKFDIRAIQGKASYPSILQTAEADKADLLIAATNYDEINIVACQIARILFNTKSIIAQIREPEYFSRNDLFKNSSMAIDAVIHPEEEVTSHILKLIQYPGALQVLNFANDHIQLVVMKAYYGGKIVGKEVRFIKENIPSVDIKIISIYRQNESIIPSETTTIDAGDDVFFIAKHNDVAKIMKELQRLNHNYKKIIIAGGGNIGLKLAQRIEQDFHVKIIERDTETCKILSESLNNSLILNGSGCDKKLLESENINKTDIFCSMINDDENNIITSILAKRLGAKKVIALINNPALIDLFQGSEIDVAVSPQLIIANSLLKNVKHRHMVNAYSLSRGNSEVIEIIVSDNKDSSKVIGKMVSELKLPTGVIVSAILRENDVYIAKDTIKIQANDHVIIFLTSKHNTTFIESLFNQI